MQAILIHQFGEAGQLQFGEWPQPEPGPQEIRVHVAATALNRADIMQRRGKYPPPEGASPILGLEMAGTVEAVGREVERWQVGDRVCGLLSGGGYAEYAVIHQDLALPVPEKLNIEEAAALPEVFLTAFQALRWLADLQKDETVLIHAGASGVGTAAIQLARAMEAVPLVTASGPKHQLCLELGARRAIDYRRENFAEVIAEHTDGRGANVILDFIGAPYLQANLECLAMEGRLVILALMGGLRSRELNLLPILRNRLQITGTTLRARSLHYKIELSRALHQFTWPLFEKGRLRPVIDSVYDWNDVVDAHHRMEQNENVGKIVLRVNAK